MKQITEIIFLNICRGLFNSHKLIFAFCIASKILRQIGEINYGEWSMFLRGVIVDGDIKTIMNPAPDLMSDKAWKYILNLETLHPYLEGLSEKFDHSLEIWKTWLKCDDPTELPLPNGYD